MSSNDPDEGGSPQASTDLLREFVRQGEVKLNAILELATAANLRATTLCGIFGTSSVALGGAVLAYAASNHQHLPLILAGIVAGLGFFIAAMVAGWATVPRDFYIAGASPLLPFRTRAWLGRGWCSLDEVLGAMGQRYAEDIAKDTEVVRGRCSLCSVWAIGIGFAAPWLGIAVYLGCALLPS